VLGSRDVKTCSFKLTDEGLFGTAQPPDTYWAHGLVASMKRGDINAASFGFYIVSSHWRVQDGWDVEVLDEVDWIEGSVVTFPRFPATNNRMRVLVPAGVAKQDVASVSRALNRVVYDLEMDDTDRSLLTAHGSLFDNHLPIEIKEKLKKRVISSASLVVLPPEVELVKAEAERVLMDATITELQDAVDRLHLP